MILLSLSSDVFGLYFILTAYLVLRYVYHNVYLLHWILYYFIVNEHSLTVYLNGECYKWALNKAINSNSGFKSSFIFGIPVPHGPQMLAWIKLIGYLLIKGLIQMRFCAFLYILCIWATLVYCLDSVHHYYESRRRTFNDNRPEHKERVKLNESLKKKRFSETGMQLGIVWLTVFVNFHLLSCIKDGENVWCLTKKGRCGGNSVNSIWRRKAKMRKLMLSGNTT